MPKPAAARADRTDPPARKRESRAAILPSQSVHHCTPPVVLEGVVYPVLGDPVDLDPCSNKHSIVRARRAIMPPDNGLAVDWRGTVFCNPPYGYPEINDWVEACIKANRFFGAEVIGLFPANVSAEWYDMVAATARAAFLWGPGDGGRRIKFGGNIHSATFASVLVYWGARLPIFVRHAIRYCHPWYPDYDLRLTRALLADANGSGDALTALAVAEELLVQSRHDDLGAALVALGDLTLGEIMDFGTSAILQRLRGLSAYELASALMCSTRPGTHWLDRRLPRTLSVPDPRQGALTFALPESPEELDETVLRLLRRSADGLSVAQLIQHTGQSRGKVRRSLDRLRDTKTVSKGTTTNKAAYAALGEEGQHGTRKP